MSAPPRPPGPCCGICELWDNCHQQDDMRAYIEYLEATVKDLLEREARD